MLKIKKLFVKYNTAQKPSIENISLEIKKGDRVAILGPSGCGKTTLLHVIAGLLNSKNCQIKGQYEWSFELGKKPLIRIVFQESRLLPWRTVKDNIALGLEIKKFKKEQISAKVQQMLQLVRLEDFADSYPAQLSIGMQQRVNFARALACDPDLLLLDEPFSALDIQTKNSIQSQFLEVLKQKNTTSIFVTHNLQEALFMANRIIVLSERPAVIKEEFSNDDYLRVGAETLSSLEFFEE